VREPWQWFDLTVSLRFELLVISRGNSLLHELLDEKITDDLVHRLVFFWIQRRVPPHWLHLEGCASLTSLSLDR
jgi:hypothetical protein